MENNILLCIIITLIGIGFYYFCQIIGDKNSISISDWWVINQIRFTMILMVISALLWVSYKYNTLTYERSFYLGSIASLFVDNFLKKKKV